MLSRGYLTVGRIRGVSIRVHLLLPLGLFVLGGFAFRPLLWGGLLLIVLVHELGHAIFARSLRLQVLALDLNGVGGRCVYSGYATDAQRSAIAWGGVAAQGVLAIALEVVARTVGFGSSAIGETAKAIVAINIATIVLNLLPLRWLDGGEAWALFRPRHLRSLVRRVARRRRADRLRRELLGEARRRVAREAESERHYWN